ncbi:uncharacterized protein RJT21DRAFT_23237 [Scheffersomyces amazonensis]|uniref:uncharacterized protein n=1 Tax=Scheffersomyces amazonensis TaxID=1078765 RepID=UPI00315CC98B
MTLSPTNTSLKESPLIPTSPPTTSSRTNNLNNNINNLESTKTIFNYTLQNYHNSHHQQGDSKHYGRRYSTNKTTTVFVIPTLDDLLDDSIPKDNEYYTKTQFINYLESIHCLENLNFILDINKLILNFNSNSSDNLQLWNHFYNTFMSINSPQEINLPCLYKSQFQPAVLPTTASLLKCKKIIYDDILINLYNEFVKHKNHELELSITNNNFINGTDHEIIYRRKSETISPESHSDPSNKLFISSSVKEMEKDIYDDEDDDVEMDSSSSNDSSTIETSSNNNNVNIMRNSYSRHNSQSSQTTNSTSRGSSIGSIIDSIEKFKKVKKQFKFRRFSNEE